jgi:hypothetical protein
MTFSAVEIRFNRTAITGFYIADAFTNFHYFNPEFVSRYTGIIKKGEFAQVATNISSTDTHLYGPN